MFKQTRLKLTAWYLLVIMLVSITFSLVIFQTQHSELDRFARIQRSRIERRIYSIDFPLPPPADPQLIEETEARLALILIITNLCILVISGGLGYLLAGRTLKPIQDMLDEQSRFVGDASHELRTPITALKSALEVNLRDKTLLKDCLGELDKLQLLSESLLSLVQQEKPNENIKFGPVILSEAVSDAVRLVSPMADKKNISIENSVGKLKILGSKYSLVDLAVILLDNAVKYSSKNSVVKIGSSTVDRKVLLVVSDQGIGIGKNDLPHIFDRFYRADIAREKTVEGGYGLGLSIAKKIVEVHGGIINVISKLNKGTIITVQFPALSNHE